MQADGGYSRSVLAVCEEQLHVRGVLGHRASHITDGSCDSGFDGRGFLLHAALCRQRGRQGGKNSDDDLYYLVK